MSDYKDTLDKVHFSEQDKQKLYERALQQEPKGFQWGVIFKPLVVVMAMVTLFFGAKFLLNSLQHVDPLDPLTATPTTVESVQTQESTYDESGYPWHEGMTVESLPVYRNDSVWEEIAYSSGLSNDQMVGILKKLAAENNVPIEGKMIGGDFEGSYEFTDLSETNKDFTSVSYQGKELMLQVIKNGEMNIYVLNDNQVLADELFSRLTEAGSIQKLTMGFADPVITDQQTPRLAIEKGKDFAEQLFNYQADRLEMVKSEGVIALKRLKPQFVKKLENFPVITVEQAKQVLRDGKYLGDKDVLPDVDKITRTRLAYLTNSDANYYIPYYEFEVSFPKGNNLYDQFIYHVQAVDEHFNQAYPDYRPNTPMPPQGSEGQPQIEPTSGNPWNASITVNRLPVFKNDAYMGVEGFVSGLSSAQMVQKLQELAIQLGEALELPITAYTYLDSEEVRPDQLPDKMHTMFTGKTKSYFLQVDKAGNLTVYARDSENMQSVIGALRTELMQPGKKATNAMGFDDPVPAEMNPIAYERGNSFTESFINYHFDILMQFEEENILSLVRRNKSTMTEIGTYDVISLEQAREALANGHYIASGIYTAAPSLEHVVQQELVYDPTYTSTYFIPYYRFKVVVPATSEGGFEETTWYDVPAVEQKFFDEHPDYTTDTWELRKFK